MIPCGRRAAAALVCAILVGCGGEGAPADPDGAAASSPTRGRLVIVGGALQDDNADVYRAIAEGRDGTGPLCVFPTASGVPQESMASARTTLETYVGDSLAVGIFLTEDNTADANDTTVVRRIRRCSGFFFTGGDQSRVVDTFLPDGDTTAAYRALRGRWEEGAVISGSSAGAAMMSRVMIASGSSVGAVENGVTDSEEAGGVWIRRGMGLFDRAIIDQHFLARGRIGRLVVAVLATDSLPVGLGIDENTALVVDGDVATVRGASGVVLVDGRDAAVAAPGRGTGLRVSLVGAGDRIDLETFSVTRAAGKSPLPVVEGASLDVADPFARWSFLRLVAELTASPVDQASFDVPGSARLTVRQAAGFSGVSGHGQGVQGVPASLSAGPFLVDLVQTDR